MDLLDSTYHVSKPDTVVSHHGWPTPGLTCKLIEMASRRTIEAYHTWSEPTGLRMNFFECNMPYTHGYSAALSELHVWTLHSHHPDTGPIIYGDIKPPPQGLLWVHMPIDHDEYITEIWAVSGRGSPFFSLMVGKDDPVFIPYRTNAMFPLVLDKQGTSRPVWPLHRKV